jgi:hypothetical protein
MTAVGETVIDRDRVEMIASMTDAPMRNLYITQAYHELALQMGDIVGCEDACWATFGCWASKTAGTFIRSQELPRFVERTKKRRPELEWHRNESGDETEELVTGLSDMVLHPLRTWTAVLVRISTHTALYVGEGNRVVFAELAASFADFIDVFRDGDLGDHRLVALLAKYRDGPTEPDTFDVDHSSELITSEQHGGQGWLKDMLRTLHRAALSDDPDQKAQLMLLASAYGGLQRAYRRRDDRARRLPA